MKALLSLSEGGLAGRHPQYSFEDVLGRWKITLEFVLEVTDFFQGNAKARSDSGETLGRNDVCKSLLPEKF